ncbi:MAG TPA: methylmalonyl-CoA mutase family protein [Oligoflexia bacterium]|nr:methylmalonyl-CoA mutase family protein [Oligoflexia bacterium]HMP49017.1 methylmalonyl-CoA mutase family protein [Oligoflexia bacterium]
MSKKKTVSKKEWERDGIKDSERKSSFQSLSGFNVPVFNSPDEVPEDISFPGIYPYTRGVRTKGYRNRLWTMRQFAGFGDPEDTNKRFKFLLSQGQTGLSTAFDMPSLMGYDPTHALSEGEVGREGVSLACIEDMESLFRDIDLTKVSTSMTINCSASPALAMYFALGIKRGYSLHDMAGTIQNDILKEFIAQKEWISPPEPSLRIVGDTIEYCSREARRFHPVSISGYHIREAGATAVQELAFTLYNGITYVEHCIKRGMDIDSFAPRLSFFWDVHNDFFEEIAKARAARRMWARFMKERFNAKNPRSLMLRAHSQTAGVSLTAQQPLNNVARVAIQALASVLGGTQSLHTNALDETLSLPTEEAVTVALRTQQIIAFETGVADTVDPLAGSYFVESLTGSMEEEAMKYINKLDEMGGMLKAIDLGYPQREIADSAYRFQRELESGERVIVGVTKFMESSKSRSIPIHKVPLELEKNRREQFSAFLSRRDKVKVDKHLIAIEGACRDKKNVMPLLIEGVLEGITIGEISDIYRKVFGVYKDPGFF